MHAASTWSKSTVHACCVSVVHNIKGTLRCKDGYATTTASNTMNLKLFNQRYNNESPRGDKDVVFAQATTLEHAVLSRVYNVGIPNRKNARV